MHLWGILDRARTLWPERVAVVDGDRQLDYREVCRRAEALAAALHARAIASGDRVAVLENNTLEMLLAYFGTAAVGAVLVPINTRLVVEEIEAVLADAGAALLLVGDDVRRPLPAGVAVAALSELTRESATRITPAVVAGAAPAQIYYTSGTTGEPKGVVLTHDNVGTHALAAIAELSLSDADVWGHFAPMFHLADAWATFAVTWVGGCHVMVKRFDAAAVLAAIERQRVTVTNLIPTMIGAVLAEPSLPRSDLGSMRLLLSGGAAIAPEVVRRAEAAFGCAYAQTYGMTETSPFLTISLLKAHLRALPQQQQLAFRCKTGRPFLTVELRVVAGDGLPVANDEHEVGEIEVRGPTVTPGYWQRPDATAAAFRDGWLRTGDLAVLDAEGYVTIVDRCKDVIVTGGETVHSIQVENVLYRHSAVQEAAVFAVPDPHWGEVVAAAVVLRADADADADALIAHCRAHLAGFKVPRQIRLMAALPRTGSGKISKRALRDDAARG